MPSDESNVKALNLIDQAVKMDQEKDLEGALTLYKSALEYLIPLITNEKNSSRKSNLRKKVDQYIQRAEAIKKELGFTSGLTTSSSGISPTTSINTGSCIC